MLRVSSVLLCLCAAACARQSAPPGAPAAAAFTPCGPIANLDDSDLPPSSVTVVREAQEDFCRVLVNGAPIHARRVARWQKRPLGTYYQGRGYRLIMVRDTFEAGGAYFGSYGPVLYFQSEESGPGIAQMSQVRVVRLPPVR